MLHDLLPAIDVTELIDGGKVWQQNLVCGFWGWSSTAVHCDNSFFFPPSLDLPAVIAGSSPAWSRRLGWRPLNLAVQMCPWVPSTALMLWRFYFPIVNTSTWRKIRDKTLDQVSLCLISIFPREPGVRWGMTEELTSGTQGAGEVLCWPPLLAPSVVEHPPAFLLQRAWGLINCSIPWFPGQIKASKVVLTAWWRRC